MELKETIKITIYIVLIILLSLSGMFYLILNGFVIFGVAFFIVGMLTIVFMFFGNHIFPNYFEKLDKKRQVLPKLQV